LERDYELLPFPTDITGSMQQYLTPGGYVNPGLAITYNSDERKNLSGDLLIKYAGFYGGNILNVEPSCIYKAIPWGRFAISADYNNIWMPAPNGRTQIWLVGPQMEIFLNTKMALTTFIQYNTQIDNLNINTRFQWEFKPLSFLYIVYTDNYLPENFTKINRALILKINYWLNL
jgi:hypothetical protein